MNAIAQLKKDITPGGQDYETVREVIELITEEYRDQPSRGMRADRHGQ